MSGASQLFSLVYPFSFSVFEPLGCVLFLVILSLPGYNTYSKLTVAISFLDFYAADFVS
jgi:hypothetical protein